MKLISRLLFVCTFLTGFQVSVEAQILDRLSRSIDKAIDQEVGKITERMAERIIERVLSGKSAETDSLEQYQSQDTSSSSSSSSSLDLSSIFGKSKTKVDRSFTFDYAMKVNIENGKESNSYTVLLPEKGAYSGMEIENMFVIIDYDTGDSYTIMNDKLMQINMTGLIEKMSNQVKIDEENASTPTIKKTGRSEKIAGYQCEEYIIETDDSYVEAWITEDFLGQDIRSSAIIKIIRLEGDGGHLNENGSALKIVSTDKKKKNDVTTMTVESVTKELRTVDLSQY